MANRFYKVGALATDTIGDVIFLWGKVSTAGNVTHLRTNFSTSGYQTTSGKTLYLAKLLVHASTNASNNDYVKIGYADNDVGFDTTTARTNPVMSFGVDDTNANGFIYNLSLEFSGSSRTPLGQNKGLNDIIPIAASTKYPFIRYASSGSMSAVSIFCWCIEQ